MSCATSQGCSRVEGEVMEDRIKQKKKIVGRIDTSSTEILNPPR